MKMIKKKVTSIQIAKSVYENEKRSKNKKKECKSNNKNKGNRSSGNRLKNFQK
jgi:hypothetical protein